MLYFRHDDRIARDPEHVCQDLVAVGLLTPKEATVLNAAHPKMRDCLLAWISNLFQSDVRAGHISSFLTTKFLDELARCRAKMAALSDSYDTYPTRTHNAMLGVTIRILIWALMLKYAGDANDSSACVNGSSIAMSFFIVGCYLGMLNLMKILAASPFDHTSKEPVNIDALLCSTETCIYTTLRSSYADLDESSFEGLDSTKELSVEASGKQLEKQCGLQAGKSMLMASAMEAGECK